MSVRSVGCLSAAAGCAAIAVISAVLAGCQPPLPAAIVGAPNRGNPFAGESNPLPSLETLAGADQTFHVKVGPPEASLAVSVVEPVAGRDTPRGTVLVIHGIYVRSVTMMGTAKALSKAGYRAVLVDLRGHGRSSGEYLTYGVQEAKDLSQVIDALQQRGLVAGKIGVYGISYGATTSIHLAGVDPRVQAVVAVAPFSTMCDEVPHFGRTLVPGVGAAIPEDTYQEAITEAGRTAGFDPDEASAVAAIQRTSAPVLIMHGTDDKIVPSWHGVRLHEAAPDHSRLVLIPGLGHSTIWCDERHEVADRACAWFDLYLAGRTSVAR